MKTKERYPEKFVSESEACLRAFLEQCFGSCEKTTLEAAGQEYFASNINFRGTISGQLVLVASSQFADSFHPLREDAGGLSKKQLQDWIGELANECLGSLKASIEKFGIEIELGLPASTHVEDFFAGDYSGESWSCFRYSLSGSQFFFYLRADGVGSCDFSKTIETNEDDSFIF